MNREQLKTLINEAIKEVLSEKTPKGFNPKLKKQITAKKTKKLKEQDEMQPVDPQASAEPDAGEVEGPEDVGPTGNELLLAKIDNIIEALNDLKAGIQGDAEGGEESGEENEMGEEELNGEPEDEQV